MKAIQLTRGYKALVDDADYEWLNKWKWYAVKGTSTYYVMTYIKNRSTRMHRLILGLTDPKILGDHKDHNGLNNQRHNIRICTISENQKNKISRGSSKYLGVCLQKNKYTRFFKKGEKNENIYASVLEGINKD